MNIGVCRNTGKTYSGRMEHGSELPSSLMISPCKLVTDKRDCDQGPNTASPTQGFLFREDFFDPKSRIRRGRVYSAYSSQPHTWRSSNGAVYGELETYGRYSVWSQFYNQDQKHIYVLLGDERRFTVWKLVDIEMIVTGEEMVTLKAMTTFGLLPELFESDIPAHELPLIKDSLQKVADEMYTSSAESVVDCCREAASAIVGAYVEQPTKDLGKLVTTLGSKSFEKNLAQNAAAIINRFHPRRKPAEIRGKGIRRISDEDAQLAVQCLSTILLELDWGRW